MVQYRVKDPVGGPQGELRIVLLSFPEPVQQMQGLKARIDKVANQVQRQQH